MGLIKVSAMHITENVGYVEKKSFWNVGDGVFRDWTVFELLRRFSSSDSIILYYIGFTFVKVFEEVS